MAPSQAIKTHDCLCAQSWPRLSSLGRTCSLLTQCSLILGLKATLRALEVLSLPRLLCELFPPSPRPLFTVLMCPFKGEALNARILNEDGTLRASLREGEDYQLLTVTAWNQLVSSAANSMPLPVKRSVIIGSHLAKPEAIVEVYPLSIKVHIIPCTYLPDTDLFSDVRIVRWPIISNAQHL